MQLGEQLDGLKLQQSFVKELDQDDIDFAQKQYKKIFVQEMSKLSSKIQRIQRVKKNLHDIQNQESNKINEKKQIFNKKVEFIEKNKQKYMTQKLKSYKIHHQCWEHKIKDIKRKNKQQLKVHADKSKKYKDQIQFFWKTKTQDIFPNSNKKNSELRYRDLSLRRKSQSKKLLKLQTQVAEIILPEFKRQQTNNTHTLQNIAYPLKNNEYGKSIRFVTQANRQSHPSKKYLRAKNESNFSQKYSVHSLRDFKQNIESRKTFKMPYIDHNRFSQNLYSNQKNMTSYNLGTSKNIMNSNPENYREQKIHLRNDLLEEKNKFSFQKVMKKLDKICKLKQKNIKRLQPSQHILSPAKPRKSIDPEQYRLLRVKSQINKSKSKLLTSQNNTANQDPIQIQNIFSKNNYQSNTLKSSMQHNRITIIANNRLSIAQSRRKHDQQIAKQREMVIQGQMKKLKKDKIVKAIKDKIFKIKLQEIQKIKQKQTF